MDMENLIWHNERRKVNDLVPYENNPRQMTEEQAMQLKKSLERFNLVEIPAIDTDNKIIAGHQRLKILQLLGRGDEEIDVRVPNRKLTQEEFDEYNLRSNRNTGEWDYSILANFDAELLKSIGFKEEELIVNFGLSDAEKINMDSERMEVLTVLPPNAPELKEKTEIHFKNVDNYRKFKEAVKGGGVTEDKLMEIL